MTHGHGEGHGHGHAQGQGCPAKQTQGPACPVTKEEKVAVQDDPAAKALLKGAFDRTSRWGDSFPGLVADLVINENGAIYKGSVSVKSPKETDVTLEVGPEKEALVNWAKDQIGMMAVHRGSRSFEEADGKYSITFADENEAHPLGRQICIHDELPAPSCYRIKEGRIQQVSRDMGRMRFTINIEEVMQTHDNKILTTQYVVYYFSPQGQITQVESFTDTPCVIDGLYLPGTRRIISAKEGAVIVRILEFKNHRLGGK
jgi:hypothetical protein